MAKRKSAKDKAPGDRTHDRVHRRSLRRAKKAESSPAPRTRGVTKAPVDIGTHNARGYTQREWADAGYDPAQWATAKPHGEKVSLSPEITDIIAQLRSDRGDVVLARITTHASAPRVSRNGMSSRQLAHVLEHAAESKWYDAAMAVAHELAAEGLSTRSTKTPRARSRGKRADTSASVAPPAAATAAAETAAERTAARLRHAKCPHCFTRASWDPADTIENLMAQGFTRGFDPDPAGFPVCPNCRHTMVSAEPVEAPEAIRQVDGAAQSYQPNLWPDPPFNFEGAWMALEEKDDEILTLQERYDALAKQQRKAAKDLQKAQRERIAMVAELKKRRLEKAREGRSRIYAAIDAQSDDACRVPDITGEPCSICDAQSPSLVVATLGGTLTALAHPGSDAHVELAARAKATPVDEALERRDASRVATALALRSLHGITTEDVETWTDDQRVDALAWVDAGMNRELVPEVLGLPHIAGEPGGGEQHCAECGARLMAFSDHEGAASFPRGAQVGMHCTGKELAIDPTSAPEETAAAPA